MRIDEHEDLSRYLNGELTRDKLPEELREDAESFERIIASFDRTPVALPPWVRSAVMARVRTVEPSLLRRAWEWIAFPRPLQLSPLAAAAVVVLIVTTTLLVRPDGPGRSDVAQAPGGTSGVVTRFVFLAPQASRVAVTGDFANWDPEGIPLQRQGSGAWAAEVSIPPGLYHYVFVIDGTHWQPDPHAASSVEGGFGERNSVLIVPVPRSS